MDEIELWEQEISEQTDLELITEGEIYHGKGISIHVDVRDNFPNMTKAPYIKVYDNDRASKAKHELRIGLDGEIQHHKDKFWKHFEELKMTSSLAKQLTDIVNNEKSTSKKHKGKSVLDAIYDEIEENFPGKVENRKKSVDFTDYKEKNK